jgi:hypothetical protein
MPNALSVCPPCAALAASVVLAALRCPRCQHGPRWFSLPCAARAASVVLAAQRCPRCQHGPRWFSLPCAALAALRCPHCPALPCAASTDHAGWRWWGHRCPHQKQGAALPGSFFPWSGLRREIVSRFIAFHWFVPVSCWNLVRRVGRTLARRVRRTQPRGGNFPTRCSFAKTILPTGPQRSDGWQGDRARHGGRSTGLLAGAEGGKERLQRRLLTRDAGTKGIVLLMGKPQCSPIETERIF